MTEAMLSRPENRAKALVREVQRREVDAPCRACYGDNPVRLVQVKMGPYPPCLEPDERWDLSEAEDLVLCEVCVSSAARVLGLHRDPEDDRDVQKLRKAVGVAEARFQELVADAERLDEGLG